MDEISLFKYLNNAHTGAVIPLRLQYRMNRDIMSISNRLIYNHQLECASSHVADAVLLLSNIAEFEDWHSDAFHRTFPPSNSNLALDESARIFVDDDSSGGSAVVDGVLQSLGNASR